MKKIGAIIPVFSNKDYIRPFIRQVAPFVDKVIFLSHKLAWPDYVVEHGCPPVTDGTYDIIREEMKKYSNIEMHDIDESVEPSFQRTPGLWNAGLKFVQDCDLVMKLDADYFFTAEDWNRIMQFLRTSEYDTYFLSFLPDTVTNYYVTGSFEYGVDDSDGFQILAFDPHQALSHENVHPGKRQCHLEAELPGIHLHHLRGWKPKYTKQLVESIWKTFKRAPQSVIDLFS